MSKSLKTIGSLPSSPFPRALTSPIESEQTVHLTIPAKDPIPSSPHATPNQPEPPASSHSYYVQDQEPEWLSPDPPFTID